ncbi:survival protein sure-like phosphatase/nucleotidase [Cytidiella melzeri]|nr:survival protein sure-like phosphatase/nucleotidase [Cytidiella melzeri]
MFLSNFLILALVVVAQCRVTKIVLTNDDGWAVAQIRAQYDALVAAGYNVILSAPTENESGTGSSTATPGPLTQPCEFNTCPAGSPAEGFNATNRKPSSLKYEENGSSGFCLARLNWVNSFPVDAVKFGIQTLSHKFFHTPPQLIVSGPNIGTNLGTQVLNSGTVGAACESAKERIPSVAFSGSSNSAVSYTTLHSSPNSTATVAAFVNSRLTVKFLKALLASPFGAIVPANTTVSVNTSNVSGCTDVNDFKFIFTRNLANSSARDVSTCGTNHLPDEATVINSSGCHVSISVLNAVTKTDVDAATQAIVFRRVEGILSCF